MKPLDLRAIAAVERRPLYVAVRKRATRIGLWVGALWLGAWFLAGIILELALRFG